MTGTTKFWQIASRENKEYESGYNTYKYQSGYLAGRELLHNPFAVTCSCECHAVKQVIKKDRHGYNGHDDRVEEQA